MGTFISRLSTHILCIRSVRALRSSVRIHHSRLPNRISPNGHVVKYYFQRVSRATRCIFSLNGIETEELLSLCNEEKRNYHSTSKQRCSIVSQNRVDSLRNDLSNKKLFQTRPPTICLKLFTNRYSPPTAKRGR